MTTAAVSTPTMEEVDQQTKKESSNLLKSKYITLKNNFKVQEGTWEFLKQNVKSCRNTMLLGNTGAGKTELIWNLAQELGLPLTIFDMGTMSDPIMSLVGTHVIKVEEGKSTSKFVPSRFSQVIQHPGIIMMDELSRASLQANNLLFPCLDFRRELAMEYSFEDMSPIKVHPECVFFATANVGSQYTGTQRMDRALIDRFMLIWVDEIKGEELESVIWTTNGNIDKKDVEMIVKCYGAINKAHSSFELTFQLSPRHAKMIGDLVSDGFTIYDSFYTICRGIGGEEGLQVVKKLLTDTIKPS